MPLKLRMFLSCLRLRGQLSIGSGSRVHRTAQILGRTHVSIGANSCNGERAWLNVNHRNIGELAIIIGDNCFIGRDNFFNSGRLIIIGDYCLTAIGCRFICSTHIVDDPRLPVMVTGTTASDIISVGSNCFFGAGVTVLGNVNIGHGSVIGAQALVS
jgi:acetyltransferase-like isoleucine patch superfamily enzyme